MLISQTTKIEEDHKMGHQFTGTVFPGNTTWVSTDGDQMVYFQYFGSITHIVIWKGVQQQKYYDGPPISSWGSPGFFGLNVYGDGNVKYTTIIP
jgi:hypothetical protein